MAGLRVEQAYGVFHRPGFGSLVPVPRSLGTQPPFATQALTFCLQKYRFEGIIIFGRYKDKVWYCK